VQPAVVLPGDPAELSAGRLRHHQQANSLLHIVPETMAYPVPGEDAEWMASGNTLIVNVISLAQRSAHFPLGIFAACDYYPLG
jgi:hypothetical protein